MSREQFEVRTCDRCGVTLERRHPGDGKGWTGIVVHQSDGGFALDSYDSAPADICPACLDSLAQWWRAAKGPQEQPAREVVDAGPAQFTLEDRRKARNLILTVIGYATRESVVLTDAQLIEMADRMITGIVDALGFQMNGRRKLP